MQSPSSTQAAGSGGFTLSHVQVLVSNTSSPLEQSPSSTQVAGSGGLILSQVQVVISNTSSPLEQSPSSTQRLGSGIFVGTQAQILPSQISSPLIHIPSSQFPGSGQLKSQEPSSQVAFGSKFIAVGFVQPKTGGVTTQLQVAMSHSSIPLVQSRSSQVWTSTTSICWVAISVQPEARLVKL